MKEEWRDVYGFPGYEVSNQGRVRSVDRVVITANGQERRYVGKPIAQAVDPHGYHRLCLWVRNRQIGQCVHKLVAEAFIRPLLPGEEVNHKDFNKSNNVPGNYEIVSREENALHAINGNRLAKKLTEAFVRDIRFSAAWGEPLLQIASRIGVSWLAIKTVVTCRYWKRVNLSEWLAAHD